ncbi:MAG: hypothetical protein P8Y14_30690, partial [Anaerolineales bacterium]
AAHARAEDQHHRDEQWNESPPAASPFGSDDENADLHQPCQQTKIADKDEEVVRGARAGEFSNQRRNGGHNVDDGKGGRRPHRVFEPTALL